MSNEAHATMRASGHAAINGIRMYYQVHGQTPGVPLVLLHGGGSTIEVTFSQVLPILARGRTVIGVDEQGHGRSSAREAPSSFAASADDVAMLARHLGFERIDIFGFSNGASVGLQVAIRHPHLVRKLVFASAMTRKDGARPELWDFMDRAEFSNMPQALKEAFLAANPDERQLRTMHDQDAQRMRQFADVPDADVMALDAEVLIVAGDHDIVRLEHLVALSRQIPRARLLVLPGGHGDYLGEAVMTTAPSRYPALTAALVEEFLGGA